MAAGIDPGRGGNGRIASRRQPVVPSPWLSGDKRSLWMALGSPPALACLRTPRNGSGGLRARQWSNDCFASISPLDPGNPRTSIGPTFVPSVYSTLTVIIRRDEAFG
jgi:hypothetical protein